MCMNHSKKCGRKEAFGPPVYRKLERAFERTSKDTPKGVIRGRNNQEIIGFKGAGGFKTVFQHGQGS